MSIYIPILSGPVWLPKMNENNSRMAHKVCIQKAKSQAGTAYILLR